MIFELSNKGNPYFSNIHPMLAGLLQAIAMDPWERYPEGSARLLPPPGVDEELLLDWQDLVQPELRHHFDLERSLVVEDLAEMHEMKRGKGKVEAWSLEIPMDHADAWLTTLNALRLTLVEEHGFKEEDLSRNGAPDFSSERGLALMQVNFYAFVQECLLQTMESAEGGGEGA
jgi:hypothetical protein